MSIASRNSAVESDSDIVTVIPDIVLMGIQGSGKGTVGKELLKRFGMKSFGMSNALRDFIVKNPQFEWVTEDMNAGRLAPHEIVVQAVEHDVIATPDQPILFDGMPRTSEQQQALARILDEQRRSSVVIQLVIPDNVAMERIAERALIEKREDDAKPEIVEQRLRTFHAKTQGAIDAYGELGLLNVVDGLGSREDVLARVISIFDEVRSKIARLKAEEN